MKKRTAGLLLGCIAFAALFAGCGSNKATEAANESVETEKEGKGDSQEQEEAEQKEEKEETEKKEEKEEEPALKVGVLFPADSAEDHWKLNETEMVQLLEEAGYEAEILYAQNNADTQISQIQELVEAQAAALIIDPVEAYSLAEILEEAKESSIPVFAYDQLIMDTDAVKYYVTFDAREIGHKIAENIIKIKDLKKARENKESYTIEFFMGSPDDLAALFMYNGIMEVLQEYFDDGTLVCRSQKLTFDAASVMRWSAETAKSGFLGLAADFYPEEGTPDIICTAYDGFACRIMEALEESGISYTDENWPLISGVGAEAGAVKSVAEGKLGFTMFADGRDLSEACVKMVDTYLQGDKPEVEDYEQYDNGVKIIGTVTCDAQLIDADNFQILVDNGFYQESEIAPDIQPTPVEEEAAEAGTEEPEEEAAETEAEEEASEAEAEEPEETDAEEEAAEAETEEPEEKITAAPTEEPEKEKAAVTAAPKPEKTVTPTEKPEKKKTATPTEKPEKI